MKISHESGNWKPWPNMCAFMRTHMRTANGLQIKCQNYFFFQKQKIWMMIFDQPHNLNPFSSSTQHRHTNEWCWPPPTEQPKQIKLIVSCANIRPKRDSTDNYLCCMHAMQNTCSTRKQNVYMVIDASSWFTCIPLMSEAWASAAEVPRICTVVLCTWRFRISHIKRLSLSGCYVQSSTFMSAVCT